MKLRRLSVLLLIFIFLLAAFLLQRQRLSPRVASYAVKPSMATDFRLFVRTKNKTRMANVSAYYYQSGLDPGVVQDPLSIASFVTPAPLIYDGSVGDTSTGYNMVSASGSHYGMVWVLADLGSSQTVTQWEFSAVILNGFPVTLFKLYYWNGSAWVQADSTFAGSTTTGGITRGVTTTSARYWQAVFASGLTSFVSVATDYRLYDGSGTIYGPPIFAVIPYFQTSVGAQVTSPPSLGSFVLPAPNFQDGVIGDITTWYKTTSATNQWASVIGLYNLGVLYTLSGYELQYQITGTKPTIQVLASADYSTWTDITGAQGSTGMTNSVSTSAPLYQYVMVIAGCLSGTTLVSDFRLFDSLGVTISGPGNGRIFPTQQFYEKVIATDTFTRGPAHYASRSFTESGLIIDSFNRGTAFPAQNFTETILSDSSSHGPVAFAVRAFSETIVRDALTMPLQFAETILTDTFTRGPATYPRSFTETVVSDHLAHSAAFAVRAFTETVLSDSFTVGPVTNIPIGTGAYDPLDPFQFLARALSLLASLEPHMLPSKLLNFFDDLAASFRQADLAACSARLAAAQIDLSGGDGTTSTVYGTGDEIFNEAVGPALRAAISLSNPAAVNNRIYTGLYNSIGGWLSTSDGGGYASIDAFLTAQNSPVKYQYLVAPNTALEYFLFAVNMMLSPGNVFAPLTTFGTATVGAAGVITFTPGSIINQVNNVGAGTQGYTPSLGIACVITVTINGTLVITVTGNGVTSAGVPFTGHTYNITLSSATAGQTISLNPLTSGDRISQVTAIAKSGSPSATAGAFTVKSILERVIS